MIMMNDQFLKAILREDLAAFIQKAYATVDGSQTYIAAPHIELIADKLMDCRNGKIKRLIINLPPRSLKSMSVSVAFPAWLLGKDPKSRIITVSYSDELAAKHARDCRSIMESVWYKDVFPETRISNKKRSETEYETTKNGYRLSTSLGGTLTGRGGSMIIIDDPIKPQDALSDIKRNKCNEWFDSTLFSRLDNKEDGCIIIVMQRVHMDDLCAHVTKHGNWEVLNIPAIAEKDELFELSSGGIYKRKKGEVLNPHLESLETLEIIKKNIGSYYFSSQYQQNPIPVSGNLINFDWFRYFDDIPPTYTGIDRVFQSWDTAMTAYDGSDYSVCVTIHQKENRFYVLDIMRAKFDFPSMKKRVIEMKQIHNARDVIIENKGSGMGLIQQLSHESFFTIAYTPKGSKQDRMCAQSALIEAGAVLLPRNAPWLEEFKNEINSFPFGKYDDQIDALAQGLDWAKSGGISILDVL